MDISYLGGGSVKLSGRLLNVVSDPAEGKKMSADVVLHTAGGVKPGGVGMNIDGPGEYEIKEALITGVPTRLHVDASGQEGTAYLVDIDGVSVVVLGNVAPELTKEELVVLGGADVLVVPVGGNGLTLDATGAAQIVSQIEPKYVVPIHYDDGVTKYPMPQDKLDKFLSEVGASPEPIAKLKINAKEMPTETTVVALTVQA